MYVLFRILWPTASICENGWWGLWRRAGARPKRRGGFWSVSGVCRIGVGVPIWPPSAMGLGGESLIDWPCGNTSPNILMRLSRNALSTLAFRLMRSGWRSNGCRSRVKKTLRYAERDPDKRASYLQQVRAFHWSQRADKLIYVDESGFERTADRSRGWACKGQRVAGERSGNPRPRTSLLAAKWGQRLLAPILFEGNTNAEWFNAWLKDHLLKELPSHSILIMDNAAFHKTPKTRALIEQAGHTLLYLPPYSPDFNPIEQDFATMKKRRQYAPPKTTLDEIIRDYGT